MWGSTRIPSKVYQVLYPFKRHFRCAQAQHFLQIRGERTARVIELTIGDRRAHVAIRRKIRVALAALFQNCLQRRVFIDVDDVPVVRDAQRKRDAAPFQLSHG